MRNISILLMLVLLTGCAVGATKINYERDSSGVKSFNYMSDKDFDNLDARIIKDDNKITTITIKVGKANGSTAKKLSNEKLDAVMNRLDKIIDTLGISGLLEKIVSPQTIITDALTSSNLPELPITSTIAETVTKTATKTEADSTVSNDSEVTESQQFLWKPISESTGNLVILIPAKYTGKTTNVLNIYSSGGALIETGRYSNPTNGNRETYWFNRPGKDYGKDITVTAQLKTGEGLSVVIHDGSRRTTK